MKKKFEYKIEIFECPVDNPRQILDNLNKFGNDGWELVQWSFVENQPSYAGLPQFPIDHKVFRIMSTFKREMEM